MTEQAERPQVVEIALSTALRHWKDVVSLPERAARCDRAHAINAQPFLPGKTAGSLECGEDGKGIGGTHRAPALVPGKDLVAKVARV